MRVLVTGAGGFVGRHLVPYLTELGHDVVSMRRGANGVSPNAWDVPDDLRRVDAAPRWPGFIDAVIHLAAANPARGEAGMGDAAILQAVNVEGTAALARRSAREGVGRFVFLSTANVHAPPRDGRPVTETDPIAPQSAYARSKAEAEAALADALAASTTNWCVLRPAPVFGGGGRGTVAQLARLAATPLPLPLAGLGGRRSLVAVEDLVEAVATAIAAPEASGQTALIAGGAATPAEIVADLRGGSGRKARLLPAPAGVLGKLAGALGKGDAFDKLAADFVLDPSHAQRVLGWSARETLSARLRNAGAFERG